MKMPNKNTIKKAQAQIKKMRAEYTAAEKKAMERVRKDPEKALLLAAGLGAVIGAVTVAILNRKKQ
jgi:ElaB/YqjD/DUF883 family membrane-anchored ribosome-binding protein